MGAGTGGVEGVSKGGSVGLSLSVPEVDLGSEVDLDFLDSRAWCSAITRRISSGVGVRGGAVIGEALGIRVVLAQGVIPVLVEV